MNLHIGKKLTINNFISSQEYISSGKYSSHLAEVNGDRHTDIIGFDYDAVHISLVQRNIQINASQ